MIYYQIHLKTSVSPADATARIAALEASLARANAALAARDLLVDTLRGQIAGARQMQFGASSEKLGREIAQLELALEELNWEDTRVLNDEVGDYVTIARKPRRGRDWFLGSVTDENARTLTVDLDFLDAGRTYVAEVYRDGANADFKIDQRHSIAIEQKRIRKGDRLTLALAPGGG